jgi:hypothetical protein
MNAPGRPTHYKPEYRELAHNDCLLGAANPDLAEFFGVAPRTIDNWIASVPEFAAGVREGRAVADVGVARGRHDGAIGDHHTLGRTALGNTTCGVLLFSRPFIPVRKNYLTQRADACSLTSGRYSRAKGQHRRHAGGARCRRGTGVP